jgi:hypothetical protein
VFLRLDDCRHGPDALPQRNRLDVAAQLARVDAPEVQDVIDHAEQMLLAGEDAGRAVVGLLRSASGPGGFSLVTGWRSIVGRE